MTRLRDYSPSARVIALLAGLLLAAPAHAGKRVEPDLIEDALAFAQTDRDQAARLLEDAIANDGTLTDDQRDIFRVHAAEQRRLLGQRDPAWALFREVVDGGRPSALDAGKLGIALLDAERGVDDKIAARLAAPDEREVIATQNADRYLLLAIRARDANDDAAFKDFSKRSLAFGKEDDGVFARVKARLDAIGSVASPTASPAAPAADDRSIVAKAQSAFDAGRKDDAIRLANDAIAAAPDSADARAAKYLLRRVDAGPADATKIGVLLPLSGKYATAGTQIRTALELGYGTAVGKRALVYVDAGETSETALAALEKLVYEQHVVAVIGPLRTEGALDVAQAAEAMRVPLVSLAQTVDVVTDRQWVIQAMVTPADQVAALLDYTMGARGMHNFAIFAPDNPYGHLAADVFQKQVLERKGAITVEGFYDPAATNVGPAAKLLGRKDYEARKAELAKLKSETAKNGGDPSKVVLPPIVDFDAMFIPDNAQRLPIACAGLAYEEFPLGEFKPTKDAVTFPLLGLSGWNADSLLTGGGPYVRGGYFTDVYRPGLDAAFDELFRAGAGHTPTALEAVTYDVGELLAKASLGDAKSPEQFRDALLAAKIDGAITGTSGFDSATREATHHVRIHEVTAKAIIEIDPNPVVPTPTPDPGTIAPPPPR